MNTVSKLLKYDFKFGGRQNLGKYILAIMVFFVFGLKILRILEQIPSAGSSLTVFDCWIYIFKGQQIYIPSPNSKFEIPLYWLMVHLLIAFSISHYPSSDLNSAGRQILLKAGSKTAWWISKCIWCIGTVISLYVICFFILFLFAFFQSEGYLYFSANAELIYKMNAFYIQEKQKLYLVIGFFILPMVVSITLSLAQMLISFLSNAVYSYFMIVVYLVISVYFYNPLLIGSYAMIMRSNIIDAQGFDCMNVLSGLCIINIFMIAAGVYYFKKKDIIKKSGRN